MHAAQCSGRSPSSSVFFRAAGYCSVRKRKTSNDALLQQKSDLSQGPVWEQARCKGCCQRCFFLRDSGNWSTRYRRTSNGASLQHANCRGILPFLFVAFADPGVRSVRKRTTSIGDWLPQATCRGRLSNLKWNANWYSFDFCNCYYIKRTFILLHCWTSS